MLLPVLYLSCHGHECLLHIRCILGTSLQERYPYLISKGLQKQVTCSHFNHLPYQTTFMQKVTDVPKYYLASLIRNYSALSQVALVPHQKLVHIFTGVPVNFIQPLLDIVEALLVSHIIHDL